MKSLDLVESILDTPADRPFLILVDLTTEPPQASENYWNSSCVRVELDDPQAYMDYMSAPDTQIIIEDEMMD